MIDEPYFYWDCQGCGGPIKCTPRSVSSIEVKCLACGRENFIPESRIAVAYGIDEFKKWERNQKINVGVVVSVVVTGLALWGIWCISNLFMMICLGPVTVLIVLMVLASLTKTEIDEDEVAEEAIHKDNEELIALHNTYQNLLSQLKINPNSPDLRTKTLEAGRLYHSAQRGGVWTLIDETCITNDMNAACAKSTTRANQSTAQEIEKLKQLSLQGTITAEEFERGKALFLGAPPDKAASAVESLQSIGKLKIQGILSESEFNMKKWDILGRQW